MFLLSLYQQKTIKSYQNLLSKNLKDQYVGLNLKKIENKNTTNEYKYFLESNFAGVNRLFVLAYSNEDDNAKRFQACENIT